MFVVYALGKGAPRVQHPTLELAEAEAKRLANLPSGKGYKFFVAQVISEFTIEATPEDLTAQAVYRAAKKVKIVERLLKPKSKQQPQRAAGGRGLSARLAR